MGFSFLNRFQQFTFFSETRRGFEEGNDFKQITTPICLACQTALIQDSRHRPMDLRAVASFGPATGAGASEDLGPTEAVPGSSLPGYAWQELLMVGSAVASEARAAVRVSRMTQENLCKTIPFLGNLTVEEKCGCRNAYRLILLFLCCSFPIAPKIGKGKNLPGWACPGMLGSNDFCDLFMVTILSPIKVLHSSSVTVIRLTVTHIAAHSVLTFTSSSIYLPALALLNTAMIYPLSNV